MPLYIQSTPSTPLLALLKGDLGYSWGLTGNAAITASPNGLARVVVNGFIQVQLTTVAAHKFRVGHRVLITGASGVLGTIFDGRYLIVSTPTTTTAVLVPLDALFMHQAVDTGGGGNANAIQFESPAILSLGQAFAIMTAPLSDNPAGFSVDGVFSGDPGVFEVDVQVAEIDAPANYQTVDGGVINSVDATNFTFHLDGPTIGGRFAALFLRARANAVGLIASIRR